MEVEGFDSPAFLGYGGQSCRGSMVVFLHFLKRTYFRIFIKYFPSEDMTDYSQQSDFYQTTPLLQEVCKYNERN